MNIAGHIKNMRPRIFFAVFGTFSILAFYLLFTNCYQIYGSHCLYIP